MGNSKESVFRFKEFSCRHGSGSMKIGVDAVLLGAWTNVENSRTILDVGTGCGVIALMCAQRNASAVVKGIDIDDASVKEAEGNFASSPWSDRLEASLEDFNVISLKDIDLIISNPPYFHSGIESPDTPRLVARHMSELSPSTLLQRGAGMLSRQGRISMILPADQYDEICAAGRFVGLYPQRASLVKGNPPAPIKRLLIEFGFQHADFENFRASIPVLTLEYSPGVPTEEHRRLCAPFYLKF